MPTFPLLIALLAPSASLATHVEQLHPVSSLLFVRTPGQPRAVLLIHGLCLHPFSQQNTARARLRDWQRPNSALVRALGDHADVYGFAYAQNVPVDEVLARSDLLGVIEQLRVQGYCEIVLIGHSAGGVIARQLIEDHPNCGVTKVIQVCAPNAGSSWARLTLVREGQKPFLRSLTREERQKSLVARRDRRIPTVVEFVCLVGTGAGMGDGLVHRACQWSLDLQQQGIPALTAPVIHWQAMRGDKLIGTFVDLVRRPIARWPADRVAQERSRVLGD